MILRQLHMALMGSAVGRFGACFATDAFPTSTISGVNQTPAAPPIPHPPEFDVDPQAIISQAGEAAVTTLVDGATIDLDCNNTKGRRFQVTLGGNRTFNTFKNPANGQVIKIIITQDGTGSRTVTWPSNVVWPAATAPTLTTTAGHSDFINLVFYAETNGGLGNWFGLAANANYIIP